MLRNTEFCPHEVARNLPIFVVKSDVMPGTYARRVAALQNGVFVVGAHAHAEFLSGEAKPGVTECISRCRTAITPGSWLN